MKILISACLLGEKCKYSGGSNLNKDLVDLLKGQDLVPVCPEVMGGLPTPRDPSEITRGRVMTNKGKDVTEEFTRGARLALERALNEGVDLAILQPRSPSCGVKEIYDGSFSARLVPGQGIFASLLTKEGIPTLDSDELESIKNLIESHNSTSS